jgi:hypothetical protein
VGKMLYLKANVARLLQVRDKIYVFSLVSHEHNVKNLVEKWNDKHIQVGIRDKLIYAASHHDDMKPSFFSLCLKDGNIIPSFRGHAKNFSNQDLYTKMLVQLHHVFSVADIIISINKLDEREKRTFVNDLFILQFCDKLDSALIGSSFALTSKALSIIGVSISYKPKKETVVKLSPYPFNQKSIELKHKFSEIKFRNFDDFVKEIQKCPFDEEFSVVVQSEL